MAVFHRKVPFFVAMCGLAVCAGANPARADEIRLKDGKKLNGVIVAYEDNMFKVKTDFGYVLVEKDKIASIIPTTPAGTPAAKATPKPAGNPAENNSEAAAADTSAKSEAESAAAKREKAKAAIANAAVKPEIRSNSAETDTAAPALKTAATPPVAIAKPAAPPPPPKDEPPANREEVQGNLYTNYTYSFRMYKAPSWSVIEDARKALPNAIVALGTSNESTLMVVGREKTKTTLEPTADAVEKRLQDVYQNYRQISHRKTVVGGLPAIAYRYRGMADGHDWSGTLVIVQRGGDVFSVLGMTYADTDLIQIQENVIARAISSMDFSPR
jgi:hypothetical protein